MSYQTKYRLQFNEVRRGTQYTIDIKKLYYKGAVTEIIGGSDPVLIRYLEGAGDKDAVFAPLKKSEAIISMISESNFQFSELFLDATTRDYMVVIYKGIRIDEILQNRDFQGGLEEWTPNDYFYWDKDTAWVGNTGLDATLTQSVTFKDYGSYDISISYCNATLTSEKIVVEFAGDEILSQTCTTPFGTLTNTFSISSPTTLTANIVLTKTWVSVVGISNLKIKEVSIVANGSDHGFNLIWKGWHQPNIYMESYTDTPYITNAIAGDGLGFLQNAEFPTDDFYNDPEVNYSHKLLDILIACINKMQVYLPIKINVNLFDSYTMSDGDDPFNTLYVDYLNFFEEGEVELYSEILIEILKPFCARMYQSNGYWVIERITNKIGSYSAYVYDWFGNETDDSLSCDDTLNLTDKTGIDSQLAVFRDRSQFIEMEDSWVDINIVQNLGVSSIIYGEFDEIFWSSASTLYFWAKNGTPDIERNDRAIRINQITQNASLDYVYYSPYFITPFDHVGGGGTFSFSFRMYAATYQATPIEKVYIKVAMYVTNSGANWYLDEDGNWVPYASTYPIVIEAEPIQAALTGDRITDWEDVEIEFQSGMRSGPITVILFQGYNNVTPNLGGWVEFIDVKVTPFPSNSTMYEVAKEITTEETINTDNYIKPDALEFRFGDLNKSSNYFTNTSLRSLYTGGLMNQYAKLTNAEWGVWGTTNRFDLIHEILKNDYIKQYKHNRQLLSAAIFGGNLTFDSVLLDTGNNNRSYLCKTLNISLKHQTAEGQWVELWTVLLDTDDVEGYFDPDYFNDTYFIT